MKLITIEEEHEPHTFATIHHHITCLHCQLVFQTSSCSIKKKFFFGVTLTLLNFMHLYASKIVQEPLVSIMSISSDFSI